MTSFRKFSGKQRGEHDDPPSYNIRFDYSNTYLDNEDLDHRLEDHAYELHREQVRRGVETDKMLKETKQNADEMLQLQNAIKNRDPYESSNRVSKSADLRRRSSNKQLHKSASVESETIEKQPLETDPDTDGNGKSIKGVEEDEILETDKKIESKPLNTLTMFLLSLQTFKRHSNQRKQEPHKMSNPNNGEQHSSSNVEQSHSRGKSLQNGHQMKRPSSYHAGEQRAQENGRQKRVTDKKEESQYGIHVKKDHTRSRRKLEEISKLEQDSKYGYVDKYEERRKKLLASCKDTKNIDDRIKSFLKEVDEFKLMSSDDNSLEKVLKRTKSAHFSRAKTFAW
ncbi:uncharacterized protein LOC123552098 [Mercenaria mercenaria]|uniref:uncharacterized protein LOC123552098 n=1 Tax=Mercenaria mercenaria TaxID=6596 RepID=UPI00234F29FF|nr:uncharacterized protein LOC123552098 [Mercenaria mercenaria]